MNTVKIGDAFENKCYEVISKAFKEEAFGVSEKHVRIYQKKNMYSRDREGDIEFDLVAEVWPAGAEQCTFRFIMECKHYKGKIPVNKVEDFRDKVKQVSGLNVKGVFITNKGFQSGAYNIARNSGIMLILVGSDNNYDILLHKRNIQRNSFAQAAEFPPVNSDTDSLQKAIQRILRISLGVASAIQFAEIEDETGADETSLPVEHEGTVKTENISEVDTPPHASKSVQSLSRKQIEEIAEAELDLINPALRLQARSLSYDGLERYLKEKLGIRIELLDQSSLLGGYSAAANVIWIHPSVIRTGRGLFILAHEFGHYKLHRGLIIDEQEYQKFPDPEYNFRTGKYDLKNPKDWIEWQANCFASSLVLPKVALVARLNKYKIDNNLGRPGPIYLDDQYPNYIAYLELIKRLAYYFGVTKTSIIYKLKELDMINDQSRLKSMQSLINEYMTEHFF